MDSLRKRLSNKLLKIYPREHNQVEILSGKGSWVIDSTGKKYLDFIGGLGSAVLGHSNNDLVKVATKQLHEITHPSNYFFNRPELELAEALCDVSDIPHAYFSNSGAEANEAAIKFARLWGAKQNPVRKDIICFENAWHGRSMATISATGSPELRRGFEPFLPGFKTVAPFDLEAIKIELAKSPLAVMIEPIIGHGGVMLPPPKFLSKLRVMCTESGTLLIFDEIQSGTGRTGAFLACQLFSAKPDILTLSKGLGGGIPIGATLISSEIEEAIYYGCHGSTYGGNPLSCASALEVVKQVSQPKFLANVTDLGEQLVGRLNDLVIKYPNKVCSARGIGLLAAIELKIPATPISDQLRNNGLLVSVVGNCLRFMPPLNVSSDDLTLAASILDKTLEC